MEGDTARGAEWIYRVPRAVRAQEQRDVALQWDCIEVDPNVLDHAKRASDDIREHIRNQIWSVQASTCVDVFAQRMVERYTVPSTVACHVQTAVSDMSDDNRPLSNRASRTRRSTNAPALSPRFLEDATVRQLERFFQESASSSRIDAGKSVALSQQSIGGNLSGNAAFGFSIEHRKQRKFGVTDGAILHRRAVG